MVSASRAKEKQQAETDATTACQVQLDQLASSLSTNERKRIDAQVGREDANQALDKANTAYYTHAAKLSRLEANKQAYEQQVRQLSANQERIATEIADLKSLILRDREEGVIADHKKSQIEPQLQQVETDLGTLDASITSFEDKLVAEESERSQLANELGRVKSNITRMETERSGLERQQRLDSERLIDIEHAIHQLSDTDPQLIVELQNELAALSDRRESEQSTLAQFQVEQETSRTLVVQHEQQLREENGVLQSAEAELEKALRIVAAQSRIDDQETGVWVENHPQITGRVLSHIELPEDERAAFEAAYPEILRAFVADRLDALDLDSLPAGVRVVSKNYVKMLPAQLTKFEKPDAFQWRRLH